MKFKKGMRLKKSDMNLYLESGGTSTTERFYENS